MSTSHPHASFELSCQNCAYVMASQTSSTGLRCGHRYFLATPVMRKITMMWHYPEVKPQNACESWTQDVTTPR
ncbi:MAG: hypothetical protein ACKVOY_13950 [Burkholderiaceae bacterium]